jgi:hypothetical protein
MRGQIRSSTSRDNLIAKTRWKIIMTPKLTTTKNATKYVKQERDWHRYLITKWKLFTSKRKTTVGQPNLGNQLTEEIAS